MAIITVDSGGTTMTSSSLSVINGKPAIAYYDDDNSQLKYVIASDIEGLFWPSSNIKTISSGGASSFEVSLSSVNGKPAIAYYDSVVENLIYIQSDDADGSSWSNYQTVDSFGDVGHNPSLAIINGKPAISYWDETNQYIKYAIADDADGSNWSAGNVKQVDNTPDFIRESSLAEVNGKPAVVYRKSSFLSYLQADDANGSSWTSTNRFLIDSGSYRYMSIAITNGKPCVSYYDVHGFKLKYTIADDADGLNWSAGNIKDVDSGYVGVWNSLAIVNGHPAISYQASVDTQLRYIRSEDINGTNWPTPVVVSSLTNNTEGTSLTVVDGRPAIAYNGSLMFAISEDVDGDEWDVNSSSESSFSSLPDEFTEVLNQIIAGNNPDNLIPFTYTPQSGFDSDDDTQQIQFSFRTVNNEFFNYDNLLNPPDVEEIAGASNCYVPEDDDVNIKHEPIFYVDLIVKDSPVKNISVRIQEEKYKDEQVKYSFIIPKFTWNQDLITDAISSNVSYNPLEDSTGSFWAGTSDDRLYKIEYNSNVAASAFSTSEDGTIKNIIVNPEGQQMYVTTDEKLKKYTIEHFIDNSDQPQLFVTENTSVDNVYQIMSWYDTNIWTALPELGKIQELDPDALTTVSEVDGFDAPFKIVQSDYYNSTFVAGTNVLWKYDGSITAIYGIEGYEISDFDISSNGQLMIALNGSDDSYLRVLDRDFFRLLINERFTNGQARYCKFCSNNFLYGLSEIDAGGDQFVAQHHAYNTLNGEYNVTTSPNVLFKPDEEDNPTPATQPVEIEYPNGGENVLIGGEVEILWKSNKSINDSVKIELYKEDVFLRTITSSTPNTGVFAWNVPATLEIASDYKIRMEWLAAEVNDANEDFSDADFSMVDIYPSSSETEIDFFGSIGVDYDEQNNQMVIVLQSGLVGFLSFEDFTFQGWVDSGVTEYTAMVVKNEHIKEIGTVEKVRIFVGSQPYLSDKWDSGIIETDLNSIYYGGGDNLTPGELYYVNIQVYSADSGWSEVQTKKWIMPKK